MRVFSLGDLRHTGLHLAALAVCGLLAGPIGASAQEPADPRRNNAAKLAGLAGFVNLECPALRSDPARLKQVVEAMGVDIASLEHGEPHLAARGYIEAYRKDVAGSCRQAEEKFGPAGSLVPGIVVPR